MLGPQGGGSAVIQGDAGYITAAAGAKVAIISRWNIKRSGTSEISLPLSATMSSRHVGREREI